MKGKIVLYCLIFVAVIFVGGGLIFAYNFAIYPLKYEIEIKLNAQKFSVKPELVASIINAESKFKEKSISKKGAVGLMQLMPSTAKFAFEKLYGQEIEISQLYAGKENGILFDPAKNIEIGTFYLSYLFKKFNNLQLVICAYNAGEGKVRNWLSDERYSKDGQSLYKIPYKETSLYLEKVLRNLKVYEKKFN